MHKRILIDKAGAGAGVDHSWVDLVAAADVELTSEDDERGIEDALSPGISDGWRAAELGPQIIRLLFKEPRQIRHIRLEFVENEVERNQEFVLQVIQLHDPTVREIVRQQWTFSPRGSVNEIENYSVDLGGVTVLQLTIDPDRDNDRFRATLHKWAVA
jgi:hypothetical protein